MKRQFVLAEAEAMIPLARQVLADVTTAYAKDRSLSRRVEIVAGCRRSAKYEVRRRHQGLQQQHDDAQRRLAQATDELEQLGLVLIDPVHGIAGFPFLWATEQNSKKIRQALFLLRLWDEPEDGLRFWRFEAESRDRKVPVHWREEFSTDFPADEVQA